MSTGPAAIVDPHIFLASTVIQASTSWDSSFPPTNLLDPQPKVKARVDAGATSAWFTIDTDGIAIAGLPLEFDVFSFLFVEGITREITTARVRAGATNGVWVHDTGQRVIWPFAGTGQGSLNETLPEFYTPPGFAFHLYLGASSWASQNRFVRFDFDTFSAGGSFALANVACAKAIVIGAEFGSSAGTPIEESQDLWTWGDERLVRPGPRYDRKSWDVFMTREQKERDVYMPLKRRGSSEPLIAVDELPAPLPATNDEPWKRHQGTLYGTITGISPLVRAAPQLFRSRIDFQEL